MKKLCLAFISVHLLQAEELQFQISLPVFASQPVYTSVVERVPMEQCQDVKVPINQGGNTNVLGGLVGGGIGTQVGKGSGQDAAIVAGTVLGTGNTDSHAIMSGLIGGAIGSRIGKGKGKDGAMLAGALLGTQMGTRNREPEYRIEQRCKTVYNEVNKQVLSGYSNTSSFMGRQIVKFSNQALEEMPATVSISF